LNAGLNLPHSCKGGNCGACRARLLRGEVSYPNGRPLGLSEAELAEGFMLLCQARALGDLVVEILEVSTPDQAIIKRLPCRIERAELLSHDVMGVFLRLPVAESFHFEPGQYVDIVLAGGRRRSFSIASPPHDSRFLELHVRRVPGGEFTDRLFTREPRNMLLTIEGPLGQFVYRPTHNPMLLVGGGTGLAPLQCILRHAIEAGLRRDVTLYWGVREQSDLYAHRELDELARSTPQFRYVAVLSNSGAVWPGRHGLVHDAVLQDFEQLDVPDIYASGPPGMVDAVRREFMRRGADPARLYCESFDYAPETPPRQRTMAATKS
jgi:CDP-4-dehydro-6-deoxyglucose reductase